MIQRGEEGKKRKEGERQRQGKREGRRERETDGWVPDWNERAGEASFPSTSTTGGGWGGIKAMELTSLKTPKGPLAYGHCFPPTWLSVPDARKHLTPACKQLPVTPWEVWKWIRATDAEACWFLFKKLPYINKLMG